MFPRDDGVSERMCVRAEPPIRYPGRYPDIFDNRMWDAKCEMRSNTCRERGNFQPRGAQTSKWSVRLGPAEGHFECWTFQKGKNSILKVATLNSKLSLIFNTIRDGEFKVWLIYVFFQELRDSEIFFLATGLWISSFDVCIRLDLGVVLALPTRWRAPCVFYFLPKTSRGIVSVANEI